MTRSAFHMRGNGYRGLVEFVEHASPGGMARLVEELPPAVAAFMQQTFAPSAWYDYFPLEDVTRVVSEVIGETRPLFLHSLGNFMLQRDSTGLHRALLRLATPQLVVHSLPLTANRYYDFPRLSVLEVTDRTGLVRATGIPRRTAMTYIPLANVFAIRAIELAGGRNVVCETSEPKSAGTVSGEEVVAYERRFSWTPN